tara:strand:+ start:1640 stop:2248 length:609 start_codon:yes stop_codon:yes gene_type:complete
MPTSANIAKINGIVFSGAAAASDAHTLIATQTASSSATLSFTLGLDSLYDAYEFRFMNMHPATDEVWFQFQVNAAGATGFNETITSSVFRAYQNEDDSSNGLGYAAWADQAQGTAYQPLLVQVGNQNDESCSGVLTLYAPSSTTYVKHFTARANESHYEEITIDYYSAGYINTTNAIDEISFQFSSGNIDAGEIKMYGIAKA